MIVAFDREALVGFVMITSKGKGLFKESLLSNFRDVLTFMLQASPVGCLKAAWIKIASGTTEIPTVPKLVYIAVDERFRGCGYGATLIDAAEAWFRQEGIGYYELDVHARNPSALSLYLAKGMQIKRSYVKDRLQCMSWVRPFNSAEAKPVFLAVTILFRGCVSHPAPLLLDAPSCPIEHWGEMFFVRNQPRPHARLVAPGNHFKRSRHSNSRDR